MKKLLMLLALSLTLGAPAMAEMAGDFTILAPEIIFPGETKTFEFYTCNDSPDGEWATEVQVRFPDNWNVIAGWYDDLGQGWDFDFMIDGEFGQYGRFLDADGERGEIQDGQCGYFYITVSLHLNVDCIPVQLRAKQYGDGWGAEPHYFADYLGYLLCVIPVEEGSWSTVKSLY